MDLSKKKIAEIIFGTDTREGKLFDLILLWAILISVIAMMLESVHEIEVEYGQILKYIEWFFTLLFSIEYIARIYSARNKTKYIFSFFGIIDLLSILPTLIGFFLTGTHFLAVIRAVRLLRVFRILKLARYMDAANILTRAIRDSRAKITVFLGVVVSIVFIIGTLMYLIEGGAGGFNSIPRSIYWAIVTLTTVGFGDITPTTVLGQLLASVLMIVGYGIIAVPTGIVTSEIVKGQRKEKLSDCRGCPLNHHDLDAEFCKHCGAKLP